MERPSVSESTASTKRAPSDHFEDVFPKKIKTTEPDERKYDFGEEPLEAAQSSLLESGVFSDLKITCNGRTWNVHKCILAVRCSFFGDYVNIGIVFDYTHLGGVVRHKRSNLLSSLMDDFSDHLNAPAAKLRWLYNVKRILPSETPDTLSMQDGDCLYVVKEQPTDGQLVELVKETKKKMKLLRQADGTTLDSAQYVSVVNMDDDDPDAVYSMLHYLYTQQIPSARWFGYTSWEAEAKHYLLAIGLADKYDLSLFAGMARKELEARIKDSDGTVLPLIVRAMHLENASKSVVAMRDFVIGETTVFFCKDGQFKDVMEAMVIEFPKFGFEVLSHATKGLMDKIQRAEEREMEGQDEDEEDEDEEDEDEEDEDEEDEDEEDEDEEDEDGEYPAGQAEAL